jgi:hypothetical protein
LQDRFARSASTSFDQQDFTESGMDLDAYVTVKSKEKLEPIADLVRDLRSATIEHRVFLDGSKQAPIMAAYRLMRKAYNLALENRKRYLRISLNSKHDPAAIEWAESYGYDSKSFRHPERDATPRSLATQSMAAYEAILRPLLRTTWRPSQVLKSDLHSINVGSTAKQAHTPWWQQPPW